MIRWLYDWAVMMSYDGLVLRSSCRYGFRLCMAARFIPSSQNFVTDRRYGFSVKAGVEGWRFAVDTHCWITTELKRTST